MNNLTVSLYVDQICAGNIFDFDFFLDFVQQFLGETELESRNKFFWKSRLRV